MTRYKQLLTYIKSAVTRNHSEKSINSILDYISTSKQVYLFSCMYNISSEEMIISGIFRWNSFRIFMKPP